MIFYKLLGYNKTILLPNLKLLNKLLHNNNIKLHRCVYDDRIAMKHYVKNNNNMIRIWRTKSFFDYWYDDHCWSAKNFIGALDYTINDIDIKIDYLYINDYENCCSYDNALDDDESFELKRSLIYFIKMLAKEGEKNKIIIDVHENLRIYRKYYSDEGFTKTNRKSIDNPFFIESEIVIGQYNHQIEKT